MKMIAGRGVKLGKNWMINVYDGKKLKKLAIVDAEPIIQNTA